MRERRDVARRERSRRPAGHETADRRSYSRCRPGAGGGKNMLKKSLLRSAPALRSPCSAWAPPQAFRGLGVRRDNSPLDCCLFPAHPLDPWQVSGSPTGPFARLRFTHGLGVRQGDVPPDLRLSLPHPPDTRLYPAHPPELYLVSASPMAFLHPRLRQRYFLRSRFPASLKSPGLAFRGEPARAGAAIHRNHRLISGSPLCHFSNV